MTNAICIVYFRSFVLPGQIRLVVSTIDDSICASGRRTSCAQQHRQLQTEACIIPIDASCIAHRSDYSAVLYCISTTLTQTNYCACHTRQHHHIHEYIAAWACFVSNQYAFTPHKSSTVTYTSNDNIDHIRTKVIYAKFHDHNLWNFVYVTTTSPRITSILCI